MHSVWSAAPVREQARKAKVATQMGNQAHSSDALRTAVEVIRSGVIGPYSRSACRERPPHLAAGDGAPRRRETCAPHADVGSLAGTCPRAPLQRRLSPLCMARLVGFRHGRLGRYGGHIIDTAYWALEPGTAH